MRSVGHRIWTSGALIGVLSGCVYYNAMWSAKRFAKEARRLESRGREAEARSQWARAAQKAESITVRHPRSRWADDALTLQIEALARSGACAAAAQPIRKAGTDVHDTELSERVGIAAGQCALEAGQPSQAETHLLPVLESRDAGRRSQAEYLAGQAAMLRNDYDGALEHFRRSREPAAALARARALLGAGRGAEARALVDTLAPARMRETERAELLVGIAAQLGPEVATEILDRQLERANLSFAEQSRLLIADGDRRLAAGHYNAAVARYQRAGAIAPLSAEAGTAHVREHRAAVARAHTRAELDLVTEDLARLARASVPGSGEAQKLVDLIGRASATPETPGARFRAAELTRDSLDAPLLAGQMFLELAAVDSQSLFAPKALVAALPLLPERHDSIVAVLETRYSSSPYTRAYHGEPSIAYAAAEDSLARELGVRIAQATAPSNTRFDAPRPGPRGPLLDPGAPSSVTPARAPRPVQRPPAERP